VKRRDFIVLFTGVVADWPRGLHAQQPKKIPRIGYVTTLSLDSPQARVLREAFWQGLRELGYAEGTNILVEYRGADGKFERFAEVASELVRLELDVIVAPNTPAARVVQQATTTIPIVVPIMGDPVGDGLVASLGHPGGNITGLTFLGPELLPKRLTLLKEALPTVSRVAALWHPGAYSGRTMTNMMKETEAAAQALGVHLPLVAVQSPDELDRAFSTMAAERADALLVFPSPMLFNEGKRIVDLAAKHQLPSMSMARELVELGGLISYGASITDLQRRAAVYVDKIIKGAKPAELPVQQPTKFELVINLKTAKALGLTIPQSILLRADEVVE
jgi:putative tryptophan/tyrosine transport system substrate-binding protein